MSDFQTTSPDQLPVLTAVPPDWHAIGASPGGPLQRMSFERMLAKLTGANLVKASEAALLADLAHPEHAVALIHSDPAPLKNGWWRKIGASGVGTWNQFDITALAHRQATEQIAASATASLTAGASKLALIAANGTNTALGFAAGDSITSGVDNSMLGESAGTALTTGSRNLFAGSDAGPAMVNGDENVVLGANAALEMTGGSANTMAGHAVARFRTGGIDNAFFGVFAGSAAGAAPRTGDGNVAVGARALYTSTGSANVAIGRNALLLATTANRNTVIGADAGEKITTGESNVIAGYAGINLTTGVNNVFVGAASGLDSITSSRCVFVGDNAARRVTNGQFLVAVGSNALAFATANLVAATCVGGNAGLNVTTGDGVTFFGRNAGQATTTGRDNAAFGSEALVSNVTGIFNTAIGCYALDGNKASRNTGLGLGSGYRQNYGEDNVFVGFAAGRGLDLVPGGGGALYYYDTSRCTIIGSEAARIGIASGCDDNVVIGFRAAYNLSTGPANTIIGTRAGGALTTGGNNILIGTDQQADSPTGNNQINIGGRYFHDRIRLADRDALPTKPAEGEMVLWQSNGNGFGNNGDICAAATVGGVTRRAVIFDYSAGSVWA